ncbi:ECF transporter S component [Vallitalea okinawensis]|uniref:ECF transporter S component n=1 Tax=Vallitalea okinawensis TaxID=2078660 RepID=UPI000CFD3ADB|nr:ECF transporter S component [Vallitalea okinawensis]
MNTKKIVYIGLFTAFGVLIPQVFHLIGGPGLGPIFLPMHIPVLIAGFVGGPLVGLYTGILSPIFSHFVTGMTMPPIPLLYFMVFELGTYGFVSGILFKKYKLNVILSLSGAMIGGRLVYGILLSIVVYLFNINLPPYISVTGAIIKGLPGIVIQIIVIPIIVVMLKKGGFINDRS